jgi:GAF domain-containing protein
MTMSGPLADESGRTVLLQSIVDLTRAVFAAAACSIARHDSATRELVFEVVSGEGADSLPGRRIPERAGLAGWALASEQPIAVGDVVADPRFSRAIAESTGYVPKRLTVYPLLHEERVLGVISILDQGTGEVVGLAAMNVLGLIAGHASAVLALVMDARGGSQAPSRPAALTGVEQALAAAGESERQATLELLASLETLLRLY